MADFRTTPLWMLQECMDRIASELGSFRVHVVGAQPAWQPRINFYRCRDRFVICAELAGLDRRDVDLLVEPMRVVLTGTRPPPTPAPAHGPLRQILALEIDDGRCEREISLPEPIVPHEVLAEQRNGLLWIELPLELAT